MRLNDISKTLKTTLEIGNILSKTKTYEEVKHGVRHHARHTLKMKFDRNEREIIDSINWWYKEFKLKYRKTKLTNDDKKYLKRCYYNVDNRIDELKSLDLKHNNYDVDRYKVYYKMLGQMRKLMKDKNIEVNY
jgi:hypothetical protein